jgi:hypothetical protein
MGDQNHAERARPADLAGKAKAARNSAVAEEQHAL